MNAHLNVYCKYKPITYVVCVRIHIIIYIYIFMYLQYVYTYRYMVIHIYTYVCHIWAVILFLSNWDTPRNISHGNHLFKITFTSVCTTICSSMKSWSAQNLTVSSNWKLVISGQSNFWSSGTFPCTVHNYPVHPSKYWEYLWPAESL